MQTLSNCLYYSYLDIIQAIGWTEYHEAEDIFSIVETLIGCHHLKHIEIEVKQYELR